MSFSEREEFLIMLLIENKSKEKEFCSYVKRKCDIDTFNARYMELLDKFLSKYALSTTEKSD